MEGHPVLDKIHRLALELKETQSREKFELCESLAALLNNISTEYDQASDKYFDENIASFQQSLNDIFRSKLSCEFRRKALGLTEALFCCYGDNWIDGSTESQALLTIITSISCIEIRVALSHKNTFDDLENSVENLSVCLRIVAQSIHRLTNDYKETKWKPNYILSMQKSFTDTITDVCAFTEKIFNAEELQTNRELRQFLSVALETITFWCINDMESLETTIEPLLIRIAPYCASMKWTQICLNIVARLDYEDSSKSKLIANVWDENIPLIHFTLQSLISQMTKMKESRDPRLLNITHYLVMDTDHLPLKESREYLQQLSKILTTWMLQKGDFGHFEAVALFNSACLVMELCQGNVENSTPFKIALACSTQVLWSFCGFNKHNKDNSFRMPDLYKGEEEKLNSLIYMWCDAMDGLSRMLRKHEFVARFLIDHKWPHKALVVPMIGNIGMSPEIEITLERFRMAIVETCPDVEEELTNLTEKLLQTAIDETI